MEHTLIESQAIDRMDKEDIQILMAWIEKQNDPKCPENHRVYYEKTLNKFVCYICNTVREVKTNV